MTFVAVAAETERDVAEWAIRLGGSVTLQGSKQAVREVSSLPEQSFHVVAVDLVGCDFPPAQLVHLAGLPELRELLLPGPIFNPGAGSKLDANDELKPLANLHKLQKLHFSLHFLTNINVQDKGLALLKDLTSIQELRLAQTKVEGKSLPAFVNLEYLDLNYTPFGDAGMKNLEGLKQLKDLYLRDTFITDAGIKSLSGLTNLEVLDLAGTKLDDAGVAPLRNLTRLRKLNLLGAVLTDDGVDALANLKDLEELNLYRSQITNAGLKKLQGLKKLAALDVRYSRVSENGVEAFHAAIPGCKISFENSSPLQSSASTRNSRPAEKNDQSIADWIPPAWRSRRTGRRICQVGRARPDPGFRRPNRFSRRLETARNFGSVYHSNWRRSGSGAWKDH